MIVLRLARTRPSCLRHSWIASSHISNHVRSLATIAQDTKHFKISNQVRNALEKNLPVVALETAIYTHGFPYPDNVALASELESAIRAEGVIPATIGILDGVARVGLNADELTRLCQTPRQELMKVSRRDLSLISSINQGLGGSHYEKRSGGTTVAGTMVLAHKAGIRVFATGGIGGVHKGAETTFDISADLVELGRTPVAVVCSGCKSFLDVPKTLEYLETQGVPVATLKSSQGLDEFPGFWSVGSGVKSPAIWDALPINAANAIYTHFSLGLTTGMIIANPIPALSEIPKHKMDKFINEAIQLAEANGITGKDNTPYILEKIKELSAGQSVIANRELVISNARCAAAIARILCTGYMPPGSSSLELGVRPSQEVESTIPMQWELTEGIIPELGSSNILISNTTSTSLTAENLGASESSLDIMAGEVEQKADIVVAGAIAVDYACDYEPLDTSTSDSSPKLHTSNPARITQTIGGVGYNVAKAAHLLGSRVQLFSVVGDDLAGNLAQKVLKDSKLQSNKANTIMQHAGGRTAQYMAVNDTQKDLVLGMADMDILELNDETNKKLWRSELQRISPKCLVVDANWSSEMIHFWLSAGREAGADTHFEPVSTAKAVKILHACKIEDPSFSLFPNILVNNISPNEDELTALWEAASEPGGLFDSPKWRSYIDHLEIPYSDTYRKILERATSPELVDKGIPQKCIQLLPLFRCIHVKLGANGVVTAVNLHNAKALEKIKDKRNIIARPEGPSAVAGVFIQHKKPDQVLSAQEIVSVNGAGDTFLGALAAARTYKMNQSLSMPSIQFAQAAARATLKSRESVSSELPALLKSLEAEHQHRSLQGIVKGR